MNLIENHKDVISADVVLDMLDNPNRQLNGCTECVAFLEELIVFQQRILETHKALYAMFFTLSPENNPSGASEFQLQDSGVIETEILVPERDPNEPPSDDFCIVEEEIILKDSSSEEGDLFSDIIEVDEDSDAHDVDVKEEEIPLVGNNHIPWRDKDDVINSSTRTSIISKFKPREMTYEPLTIRGCILSGVPKQKQPKMKPIKPLNSVVRHTTLATPEELKLEETMVEMKLFVCRVCSLYCKSRWTLRKHVARHHSGQEYFICCDLKSWYPMHFYDHFRWHLNKDAFKCQECGKVLKSRPSLSSHMQRAHSGEAPAHICTICGKGFWHKNNYETHLRKHESKEKCEYCGKGEDWSGILNL